MQMQELVVFQYFLINRAIFLSVSQIQYQKFVNEREDQSVIVNTLNAPMCVAQPSLLIIFPCIRTS